MKAMKKRWALTALPLGVLALLLGPVAPAFAGGGGGTSSHHRGHSSVRVYTAKLNPVALNVPGGDAGGWAQVEVRGNKATVYEIVSGLGATFNGKPYPHVQHIHGLAAGTCPTASADTNGDGVIASTEAQPDYGMIQTTLSTHGSTAASAGTNLAIAPKGSSFYYARTFTLNDATRSALEHGTAVVVIHGLDPATAPKAALTEKSNLVPSLPLAATAPAVCGELALTTTHRVFTAKLNPVELNGQTSASGWVQVEVNGRKATVREVAHGLGATFNGKPYPHVQHIHGLGMGVCPTAADDANHDGVIATTEGHDAYGMIQTTLSTHGSTAPSEGTNLALAPTGSSIHYTRTFWLNNLTLRALDQGNAVVVVHGLGVSTAPPAALTTPSNLVPSLPLAATAPALCGALTQR